MGRLGALGRRGSVGLIAAVVAIVLLAVLVVVNVSGGSKTNHVTAYFERTVGLYTGNDVRILGVKVGRIDSITPDGSRVKVVMSYDAAHKLPAGVHAVIVVPSIVSDRYIQLAPAYTSGPTLADNETLDVSRTRIPLELDDIFGNVNQLDAALGPQGANKHGALSRLVKVAAANLKGNGGHINRTLRVFSRALSTLSGGRGDLFATVNHLQRFTAMLAHNDGGVRKLNSNLALVGGQLASERRDLGAALVNLSTALTVVNGFVAHNRATLTSDIHGLAKVTDVLTKEKEAITQFTDLAPLTLANVGLSYDPVAKTLDTKSDTGKPSPITGPAGTACQLIFSLGLLHLLAGIPGCTIPTAAASASASVSPDYHARTLAGLLQVRP
jgi:phospholipid/cholesterol/gamma-HCH transport system substrate-binding protein